MGTATTGAVKAQTQSRDENDLGTPPRSPERIAQARAAQRHTYELGANVGRLPPAPYERRAGDPLYRPLRIYTVDPATPRLEGAVATVDVPYEPLTPGPVGRLFEVDNRDGGQQLSYRRADLDDKGILLRDGYDPSQSEPRFHQQMVYAVCCNVYATFRKALGRHLGWGPNVSGGKLVLRPHAGQYLNAFYDERAGELCFGYDEAPEDAKGETMPGGFVFTCLSHDIIAHEVTHALLDGLRAEFSRPTSNDVIAFHEAFADIVAVFQRFSYKNVVLNAIRRSRGDITRAEYLTDLARQFGHSTGKERALRSAIDIDAATGVPARLYDAALEPHELGSVLVAAIFEAFTVIYRRKTERYIRLATGGSGLLPAGELPHDLQGVLADRVAKLAGQFLSICIRAIDYCPPVGLTFGDYLRALISADVDLVPDDPWDYRGALIQAFRRRKIHPRDVTNLGEDALAWRPPRQQLFPIEGLSFANLRFRGDPACAADSGELELQAALLGEYVGRDAHLREFGLVKAGDPKLEGDTITLPQVQSVRTSRRTGPDGQIVFDLVAEVIQSRQVQARNGKPAFDYHGGSTIILDPHGEIRYAILKSVVGDGRLDRRRDFFEAAVAKELYWKVEGNAYRAKGELFNLLHKVGQPKCDRSSEG